MNTQLKITCIQHHAHWEDAVSNINTLEEKIWDIEDKGDIIVLPEMFNTGFTMNVHHNREVINGRTFKWMQQQAAQTGAVITGSLIIRDKEQNFYNRLLWMEPDGKWDYYDKRHLFRFTGEHKYFQPGKRKIIKTVKGIRICPMICYDLRFPVWSRNKGDDYDCLLYIAHWPEIRIDAWNVLLKARAIENLSYVIGVNATGTDGNHIAYSGASQLINYKGEVVENLGDRETNSTVVLDKEPLEAFRAKFQALKDVDAFELYT